MTDSKAVGGGTRFSDDDIAVTPNCGAGVFFCGHRLHSGVEVVEGERYVLTGLYVSTQVRQNQ